MYSCEDTGSSSGPGTVHFPIGKANYFGKAKPGWQLYLMFHHIPL